MFGHYARAIIYGLGLMVVASAFTVVADDILAVADCSVPPVSTSMCTQGQYAITYFPLAAALSIFVMLLFRAWVENQAPGY